MSQSYAVKRYRIEGDHGRHWDGSAFTHNEDDVEIFVTFDDAQEVAEVEGGDVIEFTTFRSIPDFHRAPVAFLEAAE